MRIGHQQAVSGPSAKSPVSSARQARNGAQAGQTRTPTLDGFVHSDPAASPYTDYTAQGTYTEEQHRVLPERYYNGTVCGNVFYKGGTISYINLLEEAVETGAVVLDETQNVWRNVEMATKALIDDKAKPLFPWSKKLYSEDGQYVFRVENGQITGATAAFCTVNGRRVTLMDMAQQLAAGVQPGEIEGDIGLLLRLDPELYDASMEIGNAKRVFEQQTAWYENGEISEEEYMSELHPILLMLLGKDAGKDGIEALRKIFADPEYGKKALMNYGLPVSEWQAELEE